MRRPYAFMLSTLGRGFTCQGLRILRLGGYLSSLLVLSNLIIHIRRRRRSPRQQGQAVTERNPLDLCQRGAARRTHQTDQDTDAKTCAVRNHGIELGDVRFADGLEGLTAS